MPTDTSEKTGDITDLLGLKRMLTARNGANREIPARICADTGIGKKKKYGTAGAAPSLEIIG